MNARNESVEKKIILNPFLLFSNRWLVSCFISIFLVSCSSVPIGKYSSQKDLAAAYLSDFKSTSVDIVFERGHNSHRFHISYKTDLPQLLIFHDKQIYKNLNIEEKQFKEVLNKSTQAVGALRRKPATKENGPCRTPFLITLKNNQEVFEVEGCRGTEEGAVFGKLVAEIEYLALAGKIQ